MFDNLWRQKYASNMTNGAALIGFGNHMRGCLLPALRQLEIPVACVVTRHPDQIADTAAQCGIPTVLGGIEQLADEKSVSAAIVAAAPEAHAELVEQLVPLNVPIFLEKPAATSAEALKDLINRIGVSGGPIMVGFQKRFAPAYARVKSLIDERRIGDVVHVHYQLNIGALGEGSDFMLIVGIHGLDLLYHLLGRIALIGVSVYSKDQRMNFAALFRNEMGTSATLQVGDMTDYNQVGERLDVIGNGHRIVVDNLSDFQWAKPTPNVIGIPEADEDAGMFWKSNLTLPVVATGSLMQQGYIGELQHFISAVAQGTSPSPGLNEALFTHELLDSINAERQT